MWSCQSSVPVNPLCFWSSKLAGASALRAGTVEPPATPRRAPSSRDCFLLQDFSPGAVGASHGAQIGPELRLRCPVGRPLGLIRLFSKDFAGFTMATARN